MRRQRAARARLNRLRIRGAEIHLIVISQRTGARTRGMAERNHRRYRAIGNQRGEPVFIRHAAPTADGRGIERDVFRHLAIPAQPRIPLFRVGFNRIVAEFLQLAVHHAEQALEQHVIPFQGRLIIAADTPPWKQLHRRAGIIAHPLFHREHVFIVDADFDLEDQARAIVPGQHHRLALAQHRGGRRPDRVAIRQPGRGADARAPAILHVIGARFRARLQKAYAR